MVTPEERHALIRSYIQDGLPLEQAVLKAEEDLKRQQSNVSITSEFAKPAQPSTETNLGVLSGGAPSIQTPGTKQPAIPAPTPTTSNQISTEQGKFLNAVGGLGNYAKKTANLAKDTKDALDSVYQNQYNAIQDQAKLADEAAKAQGNAMLTQQREMQNFELEKKRWENEQREILSKQANRVKELEEIDPNRALKTKVVGEDGKVTYKESIGKNIAAALLIGVGEFARGLQQMGGIQQTRNLAKEIIDEKIERDIQQQRDAASAEKTLYGENLRRFGSEQQAMEATRMELLRLHANELERTSLQFKGQEAAAKAQALNADLQAAITEKRANLDKMAIDAGMQESKFRSELGLEREKMELAKAGAGGARELPATQAVEVGEVNQAREILNRVSQEFQALKKEGTAPGVTQYLPGTKATKYNDAVKSAAQVLGKMFEGGKLTDEDYHRYLQMLPTAGDSAERGMKKIETINFLLTQKMQGQASGLRSAGFGVNQSFTTGSNITELPAR